MHLQCSFHLLLWSKIRTMICVPSDEIGGRVAQLSAGVAKILIQRINNGHHDSLTVEQISWCCM